MSNSVRMVDNSEKVKNNVGLLTEQALTIVGGLVESYAKLELERNPHRVDTGLLRNSITYALAGEPTAISGYSGDRPSQYKNDNVVPTGTYSGTAPADNDKKNKHTVYVGTNVEYAPYVHEGTTRMSPNHFLRNACQNNRAQIEATLKGRLALGAVSGGAAGAIANSHVYS